MAGSLERLPATEAGIEVVPVGHGRLVHAPAEEDDLTAPATGEIHEARVQVFHLATKSLHIFEGALERVGLFPQAGVLLLHRLFA